MCDKKSDIQHKWPVNWKYFSGRSYPEIKKDKGEKRNPEFNQRIRNIDYLITNSMLTVCMAKACLKNMHLILEKNTLQHILLEKSALM